MKALIPRGRGSGNLGGKWQPIVNTGTLCRLLCKKNGWTNRDDVWDWVVGGLKEPCIWWEGVLLSGCPSRWKPFKLNVFQLQTIEQFKGGGDAAFCQITWQLVITKVLRSESAYNCIAVFMATLFQLITWSRNFIYTCWWCDGISSIVGYF